MALAVMLIAASGAAAKVAARVTGVKWPASFHTGKSFHVKVTVRNKGVALTHMPIFADFTFGGSVYANTGSTYVSLAAGKTKTFTITASYPPSVGVGRVPGPVRVRGCALPSLSNQGLAAHGSGMLSCVTSPRPSIFQG